MKRIFLAVFAALASGSAFAADMPVYRKAPVAPVASWTGFYAGLNVGYGFNDPTVSFLPNDPAALALFGTPGPLPAAYNIEGVLGGAQIGYNWQIAPTWIVGLEADFQGSNVKGGASSAFVAAVPQTVSGQQQLDWFGTVRARAGFLATDKLLVYGTGGLAYGSLHNSAQLAAAAGFGVGITSGGFGLNCTGPAICFAGSENKLQAGYTAGGGIEYALWQNVTIKAEYLYVNLGKSNVTAVTNNSYGQPNPASFNANFSDFDFHVGRVGVNWRF